MILIAGVRDSDIERVKALLPEYTFPAEQRIIDEAFAKGEITIPEWALAIQSLADEQAEPFGFGGSLCAGFFSGYLTLFPGAHIVSVKSDLLEAIATTDIEGYDTVTIAQHIFGGQRAIDSVLGSVPHTVVDLTANLSDDDIAELLEGMEKAA